MRKFFQSLIAFCLITSLTLLFFTPLKDNLHLQKLTQFFSRTPTQPLATEVFFLRQIITEDSRNSRTIMWQSELSQPEAILEYRLKNTKVSTTLKVNNEQFSDNNQTSYLHKLTLTNLQPASTYEYRIRLQDKLTPWYPLQTEPQYATAFKALIFPDSQSSDYSNWSLNAQTAWKNNSDAKFFINMGDLVDNGEDHHQWRAWFNGLQGMIGSIPIAPVLGNHETYDLNWKIRMPKAYLNLFALPSNNEPQYQGQYYSYKYGDVHFVVLNTQLEEMTPFQPELLQAQQTWLKQDLANSKQLWKVILMHKDPLQYAINNRPNRFAGISDIGKIFMPIFDEYGVDLVVSAHLHTYRRRTPLKNFVPDPTGALYILSGVAGNVLYPNLWQPHPFDEFIAPQPETNNYLTLESKSQQLIITTFLPSGAQIDTVILKK